MSQARHHFHDELQRIEWELRAEGELAVRAFHRSVEALVDDDGALAEQVIRADDEVDEKYLEVERTSLQLLALQTPVASDLRLISCVIHINFHLERVGDMAVNIAKAVALTRNLPRNSVILDHLAEMGAIGERMVATALRSFADRNLELALSLPQMDDPIDRLNRGMVKEVAAVASEPQVLEWALRMMIVSRQLERVGDHAVDIGEQVAFLLTGEFREFSDASAPWSDQAPRP